MGREEPCRSWGGSGIFGGCFLEISSPNGLNVSGVLRSELAQLLL